MVETYEQTLPFEVPAPATVSAVEFQAELAEAARKARILRSVVESSGLAVTIQGRKFLRAEAYMLLGRAHGYSWRVDRTTRLDGGGWEAHCVVYDRAGVIVSEADSECGTDGDNPWTNRASYAVRSMASTRAISKALRSAVGWVVVLAEAGYEATPAEEISDLPTPAKPLPIITPELMENPPGERMISEGERRRLFALMKTHGVNEMAVRRRMGEMYGIEHTAALTTSAYEALVDWILGQSEGVADA
jgi:hypothetical protein